MALEGTFPVIHSAVSLNSFFGIKATYKLIS
jgi:hypothetical protein